MLAGIRVLDVTTFLSGPFATVLLAGLGADVVKVERPVVGDQVRANPPYLGPGGISYKRSSDAELSLSYLKRNRCKRSVTLNLKAPEGREVFLKLVAASDVVVENFSPGTLEGLGLGFSRLRAARPDIILASISGFGQTGPHKGFLAFDPVVEGMSGVMSVTGYPDSPPVKCGMSLGDLVAALYCVIGVQAALRARERTGRGQWIDVSMMDALVSFLFDEPVDLFARAGEPPRRGNANGRLVPFNCYRAADGFLTIAVGNDEQWRRLAQVIGAPELGVDERFCTVDQRLRNREAVDAAVQAWASGEKKREAVSRLRAADVAAGEVADIEDVLADPQLKSRRMLLDLVHPLVGAVSGVVASGFPLKFSDFDANLDRPAPMLGQHNVEIYRDLLGMSMPDIERLEAAGVI